MLFTDAWHSGHIAFPEVGDMAEGTQADAAATDVTPTPVNEHRTSTRDACVTPAMLLARWIQFSFGQSRIGIQWQ